MAAYPKPREVVTTEPGPSFEGSAGAWIQRYKALLEAVEYLHRPNGHFPHYCVSCRSPWPCLTAQTARGDLS